MRPSGVIRWVWYLTLFVLLLSIGLWFRLSPSLIHSSRHAKRWANAQTRERYAEWFTKNVEAATSRPRAALDEVQLYKEFEAYLLQHGDTYEAEVEARAREYTQHWYAPSRLPLLGPDSYYYFWLTEQLAMGESPFETMQHHEFLNHGTLAPRGAWYPREYFPYLGIAVQRMASALGKGWSPVTASAWVPVLLGLLVAVPVVFMLTQIWTVSPGAWFGAGLVALLSPAFLSRSTLGQYDTDALNVLMFALALWLASLAAQSSRKVGRRACLALLSACTIAVSSLFWRGWMLPYILIAVALFVAHVGTVLHRRLANRSGTPAEASPARGAVLVFAMGVPILVAVLWGPAAFVSMIRQNALLAVGLVHAASEAGLALLPYVNEQQPLQFMSLVRVLGGGIIYSVAMLGVGVVGLTVARARNTNAVANGALMWVTLFFVTQIMGMRMARLALFAVVPLSLLVGLGLHEIGTGLSNVLQQGRDGDRRSLVVQVIAVSLVTASILWMAHGVSARIVPSYSAADELLLTSLREHTPTNCIVTSWWDDGHAIRAISHRPVAIDGSTLERPEAIRVAALFTAPSEAEAMEILRDLLTAPGAVVPPPTILVATPKMLANLNTLRVIAGRGKGPTFLEALYYQDARNLRNVTPFYPAASPHLSPSFKIFQVNWP